MAGSESEFEDAFDDADRPLLLPPEDRLWRHPSEIGVSSGALSSANADDATAARNRWLTATPTRAGAWSAGLVGAMLATGVVFVGMHLTHWVGKPPDAGKAQSIEGTTTLAAVTRVVQAQSAVDPTVLRRIVTKVGNGMVVVQVTKGSRKIVGDGIVVGKQGMILVPLALVTGESAIEVDGWGQVFAARVVGADTETGLAVLNVGIESLAPLSFAPVSALQPGEWLAAEWDTTAGCGLHVGGVVSVTAVAGEPNGYPFLESVRLDFKVSELPAGAALVNAMGQVMGLVTGYKGGAAVEVPAGLAEDTAHEIVAYGRVEHVMLGVRGTASAYRDSSAPRSTNASTAPRAIPSGVVVETVVRRSPAAVAGLRAGDVIEAVNGQPVRSMKSLQAHLYLLTPNSDVTLTIARGTSVDFVQARLKKAA